MVQFFQEKSEAVQNKAIPIHVRGLNEDITHYVRKHIIDITDCNFTKDSPFDLIKLKNLLNQMPRLD